MPRRRESDTCIRAFENSPAESKSFRFPCSLVPNHAARSILTDDYFITDLANDGMKSLLEITIVDHAENLISRRATS
jgi:hypothetical protein